MNFKSGNMIYEKVGSMMYVPIKYINKSTAKINTTGYTNATGIVYHLNLGCIFHDIIKILPSLTLFVNRE